MATVYISTLITDSIVIYICQLGTGRYTMDYNYKVHIIYGRTQKAEHLLINLYKSTNIALTSLNVSSSASPYYECAISHSLNQPTHPFMRLLVFRGA